MLIIREYLGSFRLLVRSVLFHLFSFLHCIMCLCCVCLRLVSCVSSFESVFGFSILDCPLRFSQTFIYTCYIQIHIIKNTKM